MNISLSDKIKKEIDTIKSKFPDDQNKSSIIESLLSSNMRIMDI